MLGLFAAAYSSYSTPTTSTVSIWDNYFSPSQITIYEGDSITWTNNGANTHTVTFDNRSIDSGDLHTNNSFSTAFSTQGTYYYHCKYHPMTGQVIVLPRNTNTYPTFPSASCYQIGFYRNDLTLNENNSINYTQRIYNNTGQNFYVDSVNVYSNDSFINIQKNYYDPIISANSTGNINLIISANEVSSTMTGSVNVQVSGHFADGTNCYTSQINTSFNVAVNNTNSENNPNPPIPPPNPQNAGTCADISLNTQDFVLSQNETQYKEFFLHNFSDKTFYVDFAGVGDFVDNVYSELWKASSFVEPNSTVFVGAKVSSLDFSANSSGKGYVNLRSHFSDGTTCNQDDVFKNSFSIDLKVPASAQLQQVQDNKCTGFRFDAPSSRSLPAKGEVKIFINNPLNEVASVSISGEGLTAEPKTVYVNANSYSDKTVYVTLNGNSGKIKYYIEYKCGAFSQSTQITNSAQNVSDLASKVEISASTKQNADRYEVEVSLKNKSSETISGNIDFDIPNDWKIEGQSAVQLNPNSTKVSDFNIVPSNLSKEFSGTVSFVSGSQQVEKPITFSPSGAGFGGIGAAFAILTGNALLIGFIIAIVLVFAYVASMNKQKKQPWEKPNK